MTSLNERHMEFQQAKTELERRRAQLLTRVDAIERDIRRQTHGSLSGDSEERAQQQENDEVLDALDDQARAELQQIDGALERIAAGSYGRCQSCDGPIGAARLAELPFALRCIDCA